MLLRKRSRRRKRKNIDKEAGRRGWKETRIGGTR